METLKMLSKCHTRSRFLLHSLTERLYTLKKGFIFSHDYILSYCRNEWIAYIYKIKDHSRRAYTVKNELTCFPQVNTENNIALGRQPSHGEGNYCATQ